MTFPVPGITIDAGETKEVTDEVADALAGNAWIQIQGVTTKTEESKTDSTKKEDEGNNPKKSKHFISDKDNNK